MGFCVWSLFCYAVLRVLSGFAIILRGEGSAGCFTLIVVLISCDCKCSVVLLPDAVGCCSSVCDCGISRSYTLTNRNCVGQFREIPWNQTTDVHRGSTLKTRSIT